MGVVQLATRWRADPALQHPEAATPTHRRAHLLVWGTWCASVAVAFGTILANARNIPIQEDWHIIPAALDAEPDLWEWLWTPNNEHLVPVPKLIYAGLFKLWHDFRVGMVFDIALLAVVAAGFIVTARRIRGHTRWTDAFFPVVLLHLGHWENLGWGWQVQFVSATALACALLMLIALPGPLTTRRAVAIGACVVAIPLTGATALPFAPVVALAMLPLAKKAGRAPFAVLAGAAGVTVAVTAVYALGLEKPDWVIPSPGLGASGATTIKVFGLALGPAAGAWWLAAALFVGAVLAVAAARLRDAGAVPWLAFLGGGVVVAASVGHSRAGLVEFYGVPDRYALVLVPVLCCAYLAYERYGRQRDRRLGPAVLCIALLGLVPLNTIMGFQYRDWYHVRVDTFARDVARGMPLEELAYYRPIAQYAEAMKKSMALMKRARVGVFARLQEHETRPAASRRIDGLDGQGPEAGAWETVRDVSGRSSSVATIQTEAGGRSLRWHYQVRSTSAAVGRAFPAPQDWTGMGALALRVRGEGRHGVIRIRLAVADAGGADRYDSLFVDDVAGPRTIVLPWNAFGHVDAAGRFDWKGPLPLERVTAVLLIAETPGGGTLVIEELALRPGHGQIGWPFHPAATRRSLPPVG